MQCPESAVQASLAEAMEGSSQLTVCVVLAGFVATHALITGDHGAADRAVTLLAETATKQGSQTIHHLGGTTFEAWS